MGKSTLDAVVNNEIFRKDFPTIIAMRRDLASIQPVRLVLRSEGYLPGQVLGRISDSGLFDKWSQVSGTADCQAVLFEAISGDDQPATGGALARGITGGYVYTAKLLDYNAQAKSGLGAKDITDASGIGVTKF